MTVDCCEHVLAAIDILPQMKVLRRSSRDHLIHDASSHGAELSLIAIGVAQYPVRRLFISDLRRIYPDAPLLVLRRGEAEPYGARADETIRGEFILSARNDEDDVQVVNALRRTLPLKPCEHTGRGSNYDLVRGVVRVIADRYSEVKLDLPRVARELPISPARLSRTLNQEVGISFRHLLRHTRIEEAKRMLATKQYSVKEVAVRVGFSNSHYLSRSFKELTGLSATEYRSRNVLFN